MTWPLRNTFKRYPSYCCVLQRVILADYGPWQRIRSQGQPTEQLQDSRACLAAVRKEPRGVAGIHRFQEQIPRRY